VFVSAPCSYDFREVADTKVELDELDKMRRVIRERADARESRALASRTRRAEFNAAVRRSALGAGARVVRIGVSAMRRAGALAVRSGRLLRPTSIAVGRFAVRGIELTMEVLFATSRAFMALVRAAVLRYRNARRARKPTRQPANVETSAPINPAQERRPTREEQLEQLDRIELKNREAKYGPSHANVGAMTHMIAASCAERGADQEALQLYERTLHIFETSLGPEHPEVVEVLKDLADLHDAAGRSTDATACRSRANAIMEQRRAERPEDRVAQETIASARN
jgi:tetratricopeptide repeat protein